MLRKDQKEKLINALYEELKNTPRLKNIKLISNPNPNADIVEVTTWENMFTPHILNIFITLNQAGLIFTNKIDDIEDKNTKNKTIEYKDIYYFKFT